jgi:hypothetical protein
MENSEALFRLSVLIKPQCFDWSMMYTRQTYYVTINLFVS